MPETFYLQIETRETFGSRVIELPHGSVRVGRSLHCDVCLNDASLADVECVLRLRGETWYVQPLGARSRVSVDGKPVHHLRILPPGVTLRVGEDKLTLRPTPEPVPAFGSFDIPIPVGPSSPTEDEPPAQEASAPERRSRPWRPDRSRFAARTVPIAAVPAVPSPWNRESPSSKSWKARPEVAPEHHEPEVTPFDLGAHETEPVETFDFPGPSEVVEAEPESLGFEELPELLEQELAAEAPLVEPASSEPIATEAIPEIPVQEAVSEPLDFDFSTIESVVIAPECDEVILSAMTEPGVYVPVPVAETVVVDAPQPNLEEPPRQLAPSEPVAAAELPDFAEPLALPPAPGSKRSRRRPTSERSRSSSLESELPDLEDLEWPSARVILAATRAARPPAPEGVRERAKSERGPLPLPTQSQPPRQWSLPSKWMVLPAAAVLLGLASVGLYLSWTWGNDAHEAGMIADRLLRSKGTGPSGAADAVISTDAAWWKTTANHLALKAAALGTSPNVEPERAEPIPFLLGAARHASPLEPSTRLARIQIDGGSSDPLATLGMSRETVNLAVTARRLAREGKTEPALHAYRSALEMAAWATVDQTQPPVFLADRSPGRFALPNEEMILAVVRDMASQPDWTYEQWASSVPENPLVLLATHRALLERESPQADAILERLIAAPVSDSPSNRSLHLAARAEGLALRGRHSEAADLYRDAIADLGEEPVRRTWWFNLAEILVKSGDTGKIADALAEARAGRGDDEIGRLVGQAMARDGLGAKPEIGSQRLRAN